MNEEGWPVPAPYEYRGNEQVGDALTADEIIGRYESSTMAPIMERPC